MNTGYAVNSRELERGSLGRMIFTGGTMKNSSLGFGVEAIGITAVVLLAASCGGGGGNESAGSLGAAAGAGTGISTPVAPSGSSPAPATTPVIPSGSDGAATGSANTPQPASTPAAPAGFGTAGTVSGFGSVIVDGRRIDDRGATPRVESDDGSLQVAELKLGHHVEIEHDGTLVASQIRVVSEVQGPVSKIDLVANTLTVLGQTLSVNASALTGPVTIFEAPYAQLSDIHPGDMIEVHALIKRDAAGGLTLQATRIERHAAIIFGMVKGIVSALSGTDRTFKLGGLLVSFAQAQVTPGPSALVNGAEVVVRIPVTSTDVATAATIRVRDRHVANKSQELNIAGPVGGIDPATKSFTIDGMNVDAATAVFDDGSGVTGLTPGAYVRVSGKLDGATLRANSVTLPAVEHAGREAELHGSITGFTSKANFNVRGVHVDASAAQISCPQLATLSDNVQVEVDGRVTKSGSVVAVEVRCEAVAENESVVDRAGLASSVDPAGHAFSLGSGPAVVKVQWNAATAFIGIDPSGLDSRRVEVEGTLQANVLTATKIKRDDS